MNQPTPSYSFDVTAADFQKLVVDASFEQPVLVDFWAESCAPCKVILPILEKITESYQGELLLAKVNCDVEHALVQHFGIQNLPIVVLFKEGKPVEHFQEALPESAVRALLEPHVEMPEPEEADPLEQAQALFAESRFADAEALLKGILTEDNTNAKALILYGRCLAERNELAEAQALRAVSNHRRTSLAATGRGLAARRGRTG